MFIAQKLHTWVNKASILFGLGTNAVRWIQTDSTNRMDNKTLEETIKNDIENGLHPIMVIGTAGDVSTGVIDNLNGISTICKTYNLWFHIDGAYGIPAAVIPKFKNLFIGVSKADSIALDPHKWLYSPLEAGCTLVKNPQHLIDTFSSHPEYYNFTNTKGETTQNYFEFGLQNSRGFRALKVWLSLQQVGRNGYQKLIGEDIELAELLFELTKKHPELESVSQNLSVTVFRYVPLNYKGDNNYLNMLNEELLNELQTGGELFLSNAIVNKIYCLRACVVNFRTSKKDIEEIIDIVLKIGRRINLKLSPKEKK